MYVCTDIDVCLYTDSSMSHICIPACTYRLISLLYTYPNVCIDTYMHTHACIHTYIDTHVCSICIYVPTSIPMHGCLHTCIHICIYVLYIHTIHIRILYQLSKKPTSFLFNHKFSFLGFVLAVVT